MRKDKNEQMKSQGLLANTLHRLMILRQSLAARSR